MAKELTSYVASDGSSTPTQTNAGVIRVEQDGTQRVEQDGTVRVLQDTVITPKELTSYDSL